MTLSQYIEKVGDALFAARFGIAERTAMSYRLGDRKPRAPLAQRIVHETPVSWEGIYGQTAKKIRKN